VAKVTAAQNAMDGAATFKREKQSKVELARAALKESMQQ